MLKYSLLTTWVKVKEIYSLKWDIVNVNKICLEPITCMILPCIVVISLSYKGLTMKLLLKKLNNVYF